MRVWEYDVDEAHVDEFERSYGADGDWARLFSSCEGFLGTELFRSASRTAPRRYLTVDRFQDDQAWRQFLHSHLDEYQRLDTRCADLTVTEREVATSSTATS